MADRRKLAQGLMMMTPAMREDLAGREQDIQRGKTVELLRRAGKEMYENPIVNTAIGFTPGVGDVQAAGETFAALQRGAPWQETAGYAVGMLPFVPALRTTWHGSPHGFTKFDMSKIGTGEGAQAYGHGLYLAEARPVAEEYASNLSKDVFNVGGELFNPADIKHLNVRTLARKGDLDSAINKAAELAASDSPVADLARLDLDLLQQAKAKGGFQEAPGYLYKVDLPDEQIAKMLDWDKPLSEQAPEVLEAIKQSSAKYGATRNYAPIYSEEAAPYMTGQDFYRDLANSLSEGGVRRGSTALSGQDALASQHLNELGIPGIQYLDQASRGANPTVVDSRLQGLLEKHEGNAVAAVDEFMRSVYNTPKKKEAMRESFLRQLETPKTHNYVVFSDEIPQILERNGQPIAQALREYKQLESLNPTGTVFTEYNPAERASLPLGKNMTTLDVTAGVSPDEMVEIYRGVPKGVSKISPGDFITTNRQLAQDYAGNGNVISQKVPYRTILDDLTEPLGEEYIYRP